MKILGQFNLGFIIVLLDNDVFLIDQHASDEKYNYERLQHSTTIHEQNLICPQQLDISLAYEDIIITYIDIFQDNGFRFQINKDKPLGKRLSLISRPFSKNVDFGLSDILQLCMILMESPSSHIRLPKLLDMFASRACHSSVTIGQALSLSEMKKIVNHMSELDHPWNCPHGRPTLRHLFALPKQNL